VFLWPKKVFLGNFSGYFPGINVSNVKWSPDGGYLASVGNLKLNIWNFSLTESLLELSDVTGSLSPVEWNPYGTMIVTSGKETIGTLNIYGDAKNEKDNIDGSRDNNLIFWFSAFILIIVLFLVILIILRHKPLK
jgi:WD40 repeat protein